MKNCIKRFFEVVMLFYISIIFTAPILLNKNFLARGDWDLAFFNFSVGYLSLFEYGQFPLWNPFYCGGVSYIASPDNPFFSISTLFIISLRNVFVGLKWGVVFHVFIGLLGFQTVSRHLKNGFFSSLTGALIFAFNASIISRIGEGPLDWYSIYYLPWVFFFFLKSLKDYRFCLASGFVLSVMFYDKGAYTLVYSGLFLFIYSFFLSVSKRNIKPLFFFLIAVVVSIGLSAPRLFPLVDLLSRFPRLTGPGRAFISDMTTSLIFKNMTPYGGIPREISLGVWEINIYVGILSLFLALAGVFLKRNRVLALSMLTLITLSLGNFTSWAPWNLLHSLPVFSTFQISTRLFLVIHFLTGLLVASALNTIEKHKNYKRHMVALVVFCFIFFDLLFYSHFILRQVPRPFDTSEYSYRRTSVFQQIRTDRYDHIKYGGWSSMTEKIWNNVGIIDGYYKIPLPRNARAFGDGDYRGEYYLLRGRGSAQLVLWTPNKMIFDFEVTEKDILVINQNFDLGWRSSKGQSARKTEGLLSFVLKPGMNRIILHYRCRLFDYGLVVFLLTFVVMGFFLGIIIRKRRE